mgnify:CR=1 FL=1
MKQIERSEINLKINHEKFKQKLDKDKDMQAWLDQTRLTKAAFLHCKRWNSCPYNPNAKGRKHTHNWVIKDGIVVEQVEDK